MKCTHDFHFLERWIGDDHKDTEYIFYCSKCLCMRNMHVNLVRKKKDV